MTEVIQPARRAGDRQGIVSGLQSFFQMEAAGGIVLICVSLIALIIANTSLHEFHTFLFNNVFFNIGFSSADSQYASLNKPLLLWINDGAMAIFFFLIGLEIKRELVEGELSSRDRALLPAIAAVGGMAVPALIYVLINMHVPANMPGWAIPSATDIAFAVCIITMVGNRVPMSVKILLMAIAVIDDLGAIMIIALFYGHGFHAEPLMFAALALLVLFVMNRRGVASTGPYMVVGLILWLAVLQSGLHATLAGVITALFVPLSLPKLSGRSPAKNLQHSLHPWVAFLILPLFGFANAGVPFTGMGLSNLGDPITLGIALGLLIGKPVGIFLTLALVIKIGLSPMPQGATWRHLFGLSVLCGIGFTMSLFIGSLAFTGVLQQAEIRLGVLMGSVIAAGLGYCILRYGNIENRNNDGKGL